MKVLIIGSGGREHALAWKISQSPLVDKLYTLPGNGGMEEISETVKIASDDLEAILSFAKRNQIDLTVVGPEAPLAKGIVDLFEKEGLKIFGSSQKASMLESSKVFAKEKMRKFKVPTAEFQVVSNTDEARRIVEDIDGKIVIKADGLAQGKGVMVAQSKEESLGFIEDIMVKKIFGDVGNKIIIEETLEGEEASIIIMTDGRNILPLVPSQDHKRIYDGDKGPNTGGMGAYAPVPIITDDVLKEILDTIIHPIIDGMASEGTPYKGILYAGLMIKDGRAKVLEFNCRFGDPETQVVLPKLKTDLVSLLMATIDGRLNKQRLEWDERDCVCVVVASGGYPGKYERGKIITGLDKFAGEDDIVIFHAGTKTELVDGKKEYFTSGGRVLGVTALGDGIEDTVKKAYHAIEKVHFDNMYYRKDIGDRALKMQNEKLKVKNIK